MTQRRKVSNEEYEAALANQDYSNVTKSIANQYAKCLEPEVIADACADALWRCLQYHREGFNQKFTTSLCRFLHWELRRAYRKAQKRQPKDKMLSLSVGNIDVEVTSCDLSKLSAFNDCLSSLTNKQKKVLSEYFLERRSLKEIADNSGECYEKIRKRFKRALERLKEYCDES